MAETDTSYTPFSPSFFFANQKGPLTAAELANRQRIALAMASRQQKAYPKNIGEGIASLGESVGDTLYQNRLDAASRQAVESEAQRLRGAAGAPGSSYVPGAPGGPTATPAPAPAPAPGRISSPQTTVPASNVSTAATSAPGEPSTDVADYVNSPARDSIALSMSGLYNPAAVQTASLGEGTPAGVKQPDYEFPPPPSFTTASANEPGPTQNEIPATPSPALPAPGERIPVPPPRPAIDRTQANTEVQANPELAQRIATIARGEVGNDPRAQQVIAETIANRAAARGQTLDQVMRQYTGPGSAGYYPASTFTRGQASPDIVNAMLRGSDLGGQALGFSPTGNASGGVAARGVASGRYNEAGRLGPETLVQQERPGQLQRLEQARQIAALGGAALRPDTAPDVIPVASSTAALYPPQTAADAANNPAIVRPDIKAAEGGMLPSQLPIPALRQPGEEPKRLDPLGMSDRQRRWLYEAYNPYNSEEGRAFAKQQYDMEEMYRKEQEKQNEEDYKYKRQQRDTDIRNLPAQQKTLLDIEQAALGMPFVVPKAQADLQKSFIDIQNAILEREKRLATLPFEGPQAEENLARTRQEVNNLKVTAQKLWRELTEPTYKEVQGTIYTSPYNAATGERGPFTQAPGAPKLPMTAEQKESAAFVRNVTPDVLRIGRELNKGMALANSPFSSIGTSVPFMGNVAGTREYLDAQNAYIQLSGAILKYMSGSAVTPSEAGRNLPAFVPRYNDSPAEVDEKYKRLLNFISTVESTAGQPGGDAIAAGRQIIMQENGRLPPVPIREEKDIEKLAPGQKFIVPDGSGRIKIAPWPEKWR